LLELSTHLQNYGNVIDDQVQPTMMALTMLRLEWELLIVSSRWRWVVIILLGMESMVIEFVVFSTYLTHKQRYVMATEGCNVRRQLKSLL